MKVGGSTHSLIHPFVRHLCFSALQVQGCALSLRLTTSCTRLVLIPAVHRLSPAPSSRRRLVIRRSYSCCGCSSVEGSAVDGWTWSASGCCLWSRRPGWPANRSVRASWRRSCRWPWRRTWGGTWWRRAAAACRWGGPACTIRWLCSRGPGGWRLRTERRRTVKQPTHASLSWHCLHSSDCDTVNLSVLTLHYLRMCRISPPPVSVWFLHRLTLPSGWLKIQRSRVNPIKL